MSPTSPLYRTREISRDTCIRGFTGRQIIKSGVFDASTLSLSTFTPPAQMTNIYGSNLQTVQGFYVPIGSILTLSSNDPSKVMVYTGAQTAVNDVQTITETNSPSGGTFLLAFGGSTTASIAYNSTAAQVQAILQAMPSIGLGNVVCTGGPLPGTGVICTFGGLLGNQPLSVMTIAGNYLTPAGTSPAPVVTHTTTGAVGSPIVGIFDGPDRDFFNNVVAADEAVPIYFHSVSFDVSKIVNWQLYGDLVELALPTCTFY